ncbi:hypothetical protein JG688_00002118 [Phytophthora aleatoria]|uniref:Uncharacterized protein n=1 Tax=Phytophthora aleatoria TaxID=2496075 RepID=A0A8J5MIT4_9STRA|nr:hypothetical protein JG688_00002118 [Phytophthora aleatoria]
MLDRASEIATRHFAPWRRNSDESIELHTWISPVSRANQIRPVKNSNTIKVVQASTTPIIQTTGATTALRVNSSPKRSPVVQMPDQSVDALEQIYLK